MRDSGASPKAPVRSLDRHPAIARWMAELRRQQRRSRPSRDAMRGLARPDLALERRPPA